MRLVAAAAIAVLGAGAGAAVAVAQVKAPTESERAVVWAVGDAATPNDSARALAGLIRAEDPDRFLYLGDVYEDGTAREFREHYHPLYGALAAVTDPTPGNHEWANRFSGYYPYWRAQQGRRQAPWSSTSIAGWEILALNSLAAHDAGSRQLRWLLRALAEPAGDCRIAITHAPRFSAGVYDGARHMQPIWSALTGKAKALLSGHDHNLQRLRPRRGLTQFIAGAGGATPYGVDRGDPWLAWGRGGRFGALRIVLEPGEATFEFRDLTGRPLDSSRRTCG